MKDPSDNILKTRRILSKVLVAVYPFSNITESGWSSLRCYLWELTQCKSATFCLHAVMKLFDQLFDSICTKMQVYISQP